MFQPLGSLMVTSRLRPVLVDFFFGESAMSDAVDVSVLHTTCRQLALVFAQDFDERIAVLAVAWQRGCVEFDVEWQ